MISILNGNESLTAVLAGAVATAQPVYSVFWFQEPSASNNPVGSLDSATAVTLVAAPDAGSKCKQVEKVVIFNCDTAAVTLTMSKVVSGTSTTQFKVTIPINGRMQWDDEGLRITDSSGQALAAATASGTVLTGTAAGTGVTATEESLGGVMRKTTLTLTDVVLALADEAGVVAYKGIKVYDLPAGLQTFLGAAASLSVVKDSAGVDDAWDGDFSMGTVTASNNNALTSTEANLIPSTATPQAVAGATTAIGVSSALLMVDGHSTAGDLYLNFIIDDADHDVTGTACNLTVNGTITLYWMSMIDV